jgi:hypothetical protein
LAVVVVGEVVVAGVVVGGVVEEEVVVVTFAVAVVGVGVEEDWSGVVLDMVVYFLKRRVGG